MDCQSSPAKRSRPAHFELEETVSHSRAPMVTPGNVKENLSERTFDFCFTLVLAFLYNISGAEPVIDILLARLQEV